MLDLNDLLRDVRLTPEKTVVMRHRPTEPGLRKVLPWLIEDRPDLFRAFQSQHGPNVERILKNDVSTLVSFVADGGKRALFAGIYEVGGYKQITPAGFWAKKANKELESHGMRGPRTGHNPLWFDLASATQLSELRGKLVVDWPGTERSWVRRAHKNTFTIQAIHEESAFNRRMTSWDKLLLTWHELGALPRRWRETLEQWRGIYYVRDGVSGKGYVGSAYGADNIAGRWKAYAATGHGGNRLLRSVKPENLSFSILQLVAQSMTSDEVIDLENSWKLRLQTRAPCGLNDN